ncbi:MAG: OST-HTH/LOTUS domain-containing protein, partial [Massilia sp.]
LVVEMFDALVSERGDSGKIWASLLKDTLKRRRPDFNETYYGFRTFGNLLEEAQNRGMLEFGRDEKSGAYVYRSSQAHGQAQVVEQASAEPVVDAAADVVPEQPPVKSDSRRRGGRGGRKPVEVELVDAVFHAPEAMPEPGMEVVPEPVEQVAPAPVEKRRSPRGGRKPAASKVAAAAEVVAAPVEVAVEAEPVKKAAKKAPARSRRPAKPKVSGDQG